MSIVVKQLSKDEVKDMLEEGKVINRVPADIMEKLTEQGYKIVADYSIEKIYKGYPLVIEFCMGDFCVYPCSKKGHWLLEKKKKCESLIEALATVVSLQVRIDSGEHWPGEDH